MATGVPSESRQPDYQRLRSLNMKLILVMSVCVCTPLQTSWLKLVLNGPAADFVVPEMGPLENQPGGRVILGQAGDSFLWDFDAGQSFVGEIFEVNLWDRVLPPDAIQQLSTGKCFSYANVIDWATVKLTLHGNAVEFQES
ncbi:unnamed protein product [Boreogadus saida]